MSKKRPRQTESCQLSAEYLEGAIKCAPLLDSPADEEIKKIANSHLLVLGGLQAIKDFLKTAHSVKAKTALDAVKICDRLWILHQIDLSVKPPTSFCPRQRLAPTRPVDQRSRVSPCK